MFELTNYNLYNIYMKLYTTETYGDLGYNVCGIYAILNTITDRIYVGQSVDILTRWQQHEYSNSKTELYEDIKKYGLINFEFYVLEECSPRYLDEKEYYWIEQLDTFNNGYNNTVGNKTAVDRIKDGGGSLNVVSKTESAYILLELGRYSQKRVAWYQDYDCIHGLDNPFEIDRLIKDIEGH